jgi:hypothetical protein
MVACPVSAPSNVVAVESSSHSPTSHNSNERSVQLARRAGESSAAAAGSRNAVEGAGDVGVPSTARAPRVAAWHAGGPTCHNNARRVHVQGPPSRVCPSWPRWRTRRASPSPARRPSRSRRRSRCRFATWLLRRRRRRRFASRRVRCSSSSTQHTATHAVHAQRRRPRADHAHGAVPHGRVHARRRVLPRLAARDGHAAARAASARAIRPRLAARSWRRCG